MKNTQKGSTLYSVTFAEDKAFVLEGTETIATASNLAGKKLVPYYHSGNYALADGTAYTVEAPLWAASASYTKTVSETQKGKYMSWLVPFDYTITDDDLEKFDFWKIDMIAHSPDPAEEASGKIWVIIKKMSLGDVLRANMPYFYKAKEAVNGYVFTTTDVLLKARTADAIAQTETMWEVFNFYGSYEPTAATAQDPLYYVNGLGTISFGTTVTVPALRWFFRVQDKYDDASTPQAAHARQMIIFDGESETTGITTTDSTDSTDSAAWYTLDGRKLNGKPAARGIYVSNGRKVVIK